MRVFFLTLEWKALERFVRGKAKFPEGMPSVYLPWLLYKERGYEVDVFILGDFDKKVTIDFKGCNIHLVPRPKPLDNRKNRFILSLKVLIDGFSLYRATRRFASEKGPPDVVYAYREETVISAWALASRHRAIFIKRLFGTWLYFNWSRKISRIRCLVKFIRWLWPCDMIIMTNDGTQGDKIARLLRIPEHKFKMWYNGVDKEWHCNKETSLTLRRSLGLSNNDFILMCLSRLDFWKRQDRVIHAMPSILEEIPNAKLVLVGDGPKREELEGIVHELGLESSVHFTGMIEHNKVRDMLGIGDVFLQTNDLSCLGSTLLEAMICGRAIVTWDVGTTREVIIDDETGCLMPNAAPDTIAQTVIRLAKDPERRKRLGRSARRFAEEHLQSWDERLNMEIELIEQIRADTSQ